MAKFIYRDGQFQTMKGDAELVETPFDVVKDNVEDTYITEDGYIRATKEDGYLGTWSFDLELRSKTYYYLQDDKITEVIIYKQPYSEELQESLVSYLIEINGYIHNCDPEEGDVIYTSYKEARLDFMQREQNKVNTVMY